MAFIANPSEADVELAGGDCVAGIVPAGVQTRTCTACGFVDADAFVNDLSMCQSNSVCYTSKYPDKWAGSTQERIV